MGYIKKLLIPIFFLFISATGCSNTINDIGCPDGEIEWVDLLMINNIKYEHPVPDSPDEKMPVSIEKGKQLGKVTYRLADRACSNHKWTNGDAAYLEEGTAIYEVKGYPSSFVVVADGNLYFADQNKKAKTASDMYPLRGLVKHIHFESTEDGHRIHTFSQVSTEKFLNEWYKLKLEDYETLYSKKSFDGNPIFIEIELNNSASFRLPYWKDSNTFHFGAVGNQEIKDIIMNEWSQVKGH